MPLAIQSDSVAFNATADCVFIPVAALTGVTAAQLAAAGTAPTKETHFCRGVAERMHQIISPEAFRKLGFSVTKDTITGIDEDQFTLGYTFSYSKVSNDDTDTISVIPVPTVGANTGLGDFSIVDVFPGAVVVAAAAATPGAGVAVFTSGLTPYSSLTQAGLNVANDSRDWFGALVSHIGIDASIRSTTIATGITQRSRSGKTTSSVPADFVASTDPTSGLDGTLVARLAIDSRTVSVAIEYQFDVATGVATPRIAAS